MKFIPRSLLIVVKAHNTDAMREAGEIADWLEKRGISSRVVNSAAPSDPQLSGLPPFEKALANDMDAALVLGGDGTMLGIGRALQPRAIPLLGINFGKVGFLTEISSRDWEPHLQALLDGDFSVQGHSVLHWALVRGHGEEGGSGWAINDVVFARGNVARAVTLDLFVDDIFMSRLRCDGIIISTALGSTAYAASAGGPLMFPSLNTTMITPVCPFAGAFPPLVLPSSACIRLKSVQSVDQVFVTIDGQEHLPVEPGDDLLIRGETDKMPLLVRDPRWYLRRLGQRGFILPGPGSYAPPEAAPDGQQK
ncbi:MAG TPA: NAD(+)/NADH kinase [Candidatus Mailhella merdavium]|nr:NAD(+)/NADH kinase [Candidatus Mailhella merdavium]